MNSRSNPTAHVALWPSLCRHFAEAFSPCRHGRLGVVVAVSGGADSVALLRLIASVWEGDRQADRRQLIVAHYNHAARGERSAEDQRFVGELAQSLGIAWVTETDQAAASELEDSSGGAAGGPAQARVMLAEESMRARRYDFLARTVAARGARYVLTAHTADDQVETVLHHLLRGTGPAGLCGIPRSRPIAEDFVLFRPLLTLRRTQLRAGLSEIGQAWREDDSNTDLAYQRNWIRGHLLPQIRSRYPAADQAILRLIDSQSQWHQTLGNQARQWIDARVEFGDAQVQICRGPLEPAVFGLAITLIWDRSRWPRQALAAKHYQRLAALVAGEQHAAVTLPGAISAEVAPDGHVLLHRRSDQRKTSREQPDEGTKA